MEKEKRFVFLDIDGTIYPIFGIIPESVRLAINKAKENGHHVFVNSGRGKYEIPREVMALGMEGMVASAGAYVEVEGEILADEFLEKRLTDKVIDFLEEHNMVYVVSADGRLYGSKRCVKDQRRMLDTMKGTLLEKYREKNGIQEDKIAMIYQAAEEFKEGMRICENPKEVPHICKILFFHSEEVSVEDMKCLFGDELTVIGGSIEFMAGENGEIYAKEISKAEGMQKVLEYYGAGREASVAFGDGENDFEMLSFAGVGVAMGNAVAALKESADYVTAPADEDGIYKGFVHLGLIEQEET